MGVYGYARINTKRTRPKNLGIRKQTSIIREYAKSHGQKLIKVITDSKDTSVSLELPGITKIIQLAESGKLKVFIVARFDRITRSIRPIDQFLKICRKHKIRLISVEEGLDTGTKSGKLALKMLDIVAKWDSKMISDRTKEFIERKRIIGEQVGHAPFGFVYKDKKLIPYVKELKTVYVIREKRDSEELSYHKIAKFLNTTRVPSKRGGKWYAETIKTIYENPLYDNSDLKELVK